jgi:hypothetical protein
MPTRCLILFVLALGCGCACGGKTQSRGETKMLFPVTAAEVNRAVELAEKAIAARTPVAAYQLTAAVNMMAGNEYRGPSFWRLTFKRRDLIPADAESELGAGGQIFVDVDLGTGVATITGFGE